MSGVPLVVSFLLPKSSPGSLYKALRALTASKTGTSLSTDLRGVQFTLFSVCVLVFEAEKLLKRL